VSTERLTLLGDIAWLEQMIRDRKHSMRLCEARGVQHGSYYNSLIEANEYDVGRLAKLKKELGL
jgi:hypothetical protein